MAAGCISISRLRMMHLRGARRILAPLLMLALAGTARAVALEDRLDEILQKSRPGVVRVVARRSWNPFVSDSSRIAWRFSPVLRVSGNGIVWDLAGHVVTVSDLAQPGDSLEVITPEGTRVRGVFIRQDPGMGLSLIEAQGLQSARPIDRQVNALADGRKWVLTMGALRSRPDAELGITRLENRNQPGIPSGYRVESTLDPEMAGGCVLGGDGRLIGILLGEGGESLVLGDGSRGTPVEFGLESPPNQTLSESGWVIPIEVVESSVRNLLVVGAPEQGGLGVRVDLSTAAKDGPPSLGPGLPIARVLHGSPAETGGVRAGDLLVGYGGLPVVSWDELSQRVGATPPGKQVRVDVIRAGRALSFQVRLADRGRMLWLEKQRAMAEGRERIVRRQIDGLRQQLDFLRRLAPVQ